jgi:outer membrane protein assembly factor BamB
LNAADGSEAWRFTAGARIDSPPTYDRGAILFGSADGCLYRLRADNGQLLWQLRTSERPRRIGAFGQLEDARSVHGSVLVKDGLAYFTVGRSSQLDGGLRVLAVDASTGRLAHEATFDGPHYDVHNIDENYQLPMGVLSDVLRTEDDAIFMRSIKLDASLTRQRGVPQMKAQGGLLDDAYFKRMPWTMGNSGHARVLVYDAERVYCLRMFDSLEGLNPSVYFTPGEDGYLLFAHERRGGKKPWSLRIPIRGRAMAVTAGELCVAGPPDVVDPADPLAAFEGRKGGVLRVVDKSSGETLAEQQLSAPPVFHGLCAANGRLYLTLENGSVVCFGEK